MMKLLMLLLPVVVAELRCVNFYGIETERMSPVCDWKHEPKWYLEQLQEAFGLNTLRLPYSREYAIGDNFEALDNLVKTCNDLGINVILDYHRSRASHQSKTPTDDATLGEFVDTHIGMLQRYKDKIWGVSVYNEIQIPDGKYTNQINHMVLHAVESQFPGKYRYFLGCADWGHDCRDITIPTGFENRSYIDIHQYQFTDKPEMRHVTFPEGKNYFVGEIGANDKDMPWLREYLKYLKTRSIHDLCFWTIAHSTDTGGLWKDDCESPLTDKWKLLQEFFGVTPPECKCPRWLRGGGG